MKTSASRPTSCQLAEGSRRSTTSAPAKTPTSWQLVGQITLLRRSGFLLGILTFVIACNCFGPSAKGQSRSDKAATKFDPLMINVEMVKEFRQAWIWSDNGARNIEGLVLLFHCQDGSYRAAAQRPTNEGWSFTFRWSPDVIAIVHTHPNKGDARPLGADQVIANRFGVPIFTITNRGMYMYDPGTKKTTKLQEGLDWLDMANWSAVSARTR